MLDFEETSYIDQSFKDLVFPKKTIASIEFDNCTFTNCNFSEAIFSQCKFYECEFKHCNLSMASVAGCSFFDVVFEDAKLTAINWTKASWPKIKLSSPLRFYKCSLNYASFFGLGLKDIVMTECQAHEVDLRETDCTAADFSYTDFENALFGKTNLSKADFTEATNYLIDVFDNQIKKAKFSLPEAVGLLRGLDIELVS